MRIKPKGRAQTVGVASVNICGAMSSSTDVKSRCTIQTSCY